MTSPSRPPAVAIPAGETPRQRWRLAVSIPAAMPIPATMGKGAGETPEGSPGPAARQLTAILATAGLPVAGSGGRRARIVAAATLPLGMAGDQELIDVYLAERMPIVAVRSAVRQSLPPGWELVGLYDVWTGAAALPACVAAADYRVQVAGVAATALETGVAALLGAASLPRERRRQNRTTAYDLRPLLLALSIEAGVGPSATLRMRLRHGPEAAARPDEVVAALGEPPAPPLATPLEVRSIVRERLVLNDEADAPSPAAQAPEASPDGRPPARGGQAGARGRPGA